MNAVSWLDGLAAPAKWRGTLQTRGPHVAVWVLALALAVQAATIVTHLAGAGHVTATADRSAPVPVQQRVDVAAIANRHLFGAPPVATATDATNAPQSSMPLVLTGIIAASDPKDGLAILGESATAAKVYAVGDNVPGGARVHSVYEDRVLIDRGGRLESLVLPHQYGALRTSAPPVASMENPIDRARRMISEDPGLLSDVMRPQAVKIGNKLQGFRVYPGRNRAAFMRLGLRPGDMVTGINGTPLDDESRAEEIFRTIGSTSEARVTVMRNGRQQDLTLNMTQLSEAEQMVGPGTGTNEPPTAPPPPSAAPSGGQPPGGPSPPPGGTSE
jgi:general secretion pathway protein C